MERDINILVEDNIDLPYIIVSKKNIKSFNQDYTYDDAIASGMFGLYQAAKSFNPDKKVMFRTYANQRIIGQVLDDMRFWPQIRSRHKNKPSVIYSLNKMIDSEGNTFNDLLVDTKLSPCESIESDDFIEALRCCLEILTDKQQSIMSLLYFEGFNQREVAEVMGLTGSSVSQHHKRAIFRLKLCSRMQHLYRCYYEN